ncbi:MAG: Holliday junction resolvase RuvX [Lachnospiraceae bacterium]|nr:Holliday junction resolvase RuvX [Lachnospiraceae bacterium]
MTGRILGLDYGSKTVGVAVSDALGITAQGVEIIRRERSNKLRRTYARIEELVREYEAVGIVIGLPKGLTNEEGERCRLTREFGDDVARRTGLEVTYFDERLTTVSADRAMEEMEIPDDRKKDYVDEIAAMLILQGYLDRRTLE